MSLLTPTYAPRTPTKRTSRLPFHWNAQSGLLTAVTGQAAAYTRASVSGLGAGRDERLVGQRVHSMPVWESWDHDADGAFETTGLRIDPARTNLFLRSEDFSHADWTKTDTTVTANQFVAPDGKPTADSVVEGTAGTALVSQAVTVASGATVAVSKYFKRSNHDWVVLEVVNGANLFRGWFNLSTAAAGATAVGGTGVVVRSYVEPARADGHYRCVLVGNIPATTAYTCLSYSASANSSTTRFNNAARSEWGAQVEVGSYASSYIPTTTATVARSKDDLRFTSPWLVQACSLYLKFTETGCKYDSAGAGLVHLGLGSNGATDPRFYIVGNSAAAGYAVGWDPASESAATLAAYPALGQATELLVTVTSAGVPTIYQSLAGAATTSATQTAQALPATPTYWGNSQANARLTIGDIGAAGTNPGTLSMHACKLAWGVQTMAYMRAAF